MNYNKIKNEIINYFKEQPEIVTIYLFGSTVSSSNKKSKDIDIALLIKNKFKENIDSLSIMTDLSSILNKDVDIIIMNDASPLLSHEIRKKGKIIFESDQSYRKKFNIIKRKQYEGYQYLHSKYIQGLKKRYGK